MFDINDKEYKIIFDEKVKNHKIFEKGPYLEVTNSFEKGKGLKELINEKIISKDFEKIERLYNIPNLHFHQEEALRKAINGENLIVSTGTGSGKTECFLLPIINELMQEKENGTLTDGVRALIIYPMNALANDQIDRLRKNFINYPDISFGCYTGQTEEKEEKARNQYLKLNSKRIDDERLREPIENERISRLSMKERPPHILITNYAMLEYLLLRPEDNVFFDGETSKYWKYVVLDEAHTYRGSTGIEVSMLLRRLMAKINNMNLQFILTSATLGDENSNSGVINFAQNLCSVNFKEENIIRAKRVNYKQGNRYNLNTEFYKKIDSLITEGYDDDYIINIIKDDYNLYSDSNNLNEYLYDILIEDSTFWNIKKFLSEPKSIDEISKYTNMTEEEISSFVEVSSRACKNDLKLFDSRYHMFLRAADGVFITLSPHKDLFLERKNYIKHNDIQYKAFETVTCKQCHSLYLVGRIDDDHHFVQKSTVDSEEINEAFLLGSNANDTDEDNQLSSLNMETEKYKLCSHCGLIYSADSVHPLECGHDKSHFVDIVKVKSNNGRVTKCICCENVNRLGILRGFFSGQEASTSVIGTALFEELPSHEKKITIHNESESYDDDDFGFGFECEDETEEIAKAKQFIAFSDNRQSAAYFSSYFSLSYNNILYSRKIYNKLNEYVENNILVKNFVHDLAVSLKNDNLLPFEEYLESLNAKSSFNYDYEILAWQILLKEFVDSSQMTSLISLGLFSLDFTENFKFKVNNPFLTSDDVKKICLAFSLGMLTECAMHYPKDLNDKEKEYFTYNGVDCSYLEDGATVSEKKNIYIKSFVPNRTNKRFDYLKRIFNKLKCNYNDDNIKNILKNIWNSFFKKKIMCADQELHYRVNLENLVLVKNNKWYKCDKCNKLTFINVKGVCPTFRCDGNLDEVNVDELCKDNHYYKMYHNMEIKPLRVVEHTAQLEKEEAYEYQNLFKDQKIDVLSCSTTFEMGVDVGELETVFMRNMPPSTANYAQRAGRAGRSSTSAAFALTFCNRSNHDFNYFNNPIEMISGKISPPQFKTDNKKISIRHLYSSAFSFFFKIFPDYFDTISQFLEKNDKTNLIGYDVFKEFLTKDSDERKILKKYLLESVPKALHSEFKINSFGWTKWLFSDGGNDYSSLKDGDKNGVENDYPSLKKVKDVYDDELKTLAGNYEIAKSKGNGIMFELDKRMKTYRNEKIISFLSRNNILPKYGFPVDTIELKLIAQDQDKKNDFSGIELQRDMSMAISEYAPGCEVIANGKLITSRYIKKDSNRDWKKYDYFECKNCKTLNVSVSIKSNKEKSEEGTICKCKQCQNEISKGEKRTFLIPEFGFISEKNVKKPSLIKPEKTYKTEASFFSYDDKIEEQVYILGDTKVNVAMVTNDGEMAMLNTTSFFVCEKCGYTVESTPKNAQFPSINNVTHNKPNGYSCNKDGNLYRYSLGYKFKTDVIRIKINYQLLEESKKYDEAYSILQALILASCNELNLEHTEIAGCLQYYNDEGPNYSYILYDRTPGGAGNVKRLNNKDVIGRVLKNAMNISLKCTCGEDSSCYSCLRTYQNQKYHDIIKRKYVFNYLGQALLGLNNEQTESELENKFLERLKNNSKSWSVKSENNKEFYEATFGNQKWKIEPQVYLDNKNGVIIPSKPDFLLTPFDNKQTKIAVFTDGYKFHNDIINIDSKKRNAIMLSKNYRVWNLSWDDVVGGKDLFAIDVFKEDNLPSKLKTSKYEVNYSNAFSMLINYLENEKAEIDFNELAINYFDAMYGLNKKEEAKNELLIINNKINIIESDYHNVDKYNISNENLYVYLINDSSKKLVLYINDSVLNKNEGFKKYWNTYLQLSNIFQFLNHFIQITQEGLNHEDYSSLKFIKNSDNNIDEDWESILNQIFDEDCKQFALECAKNNIPVPTKIGFELDCYGVMAELLWENDKKVYLSKEQLQYKEQFIKSGFRVANTIKDLKQRW